LRAQLALQGGALLEVIRESNLALAACAEQQNRKIAQPAPAAKDGSMAWDYPRLLAAMRAYALTALGKVDEARAEVAWANGFPSEMPAFRVRLFEALHVRDFEAARRIAELAQGPLEARDELLIDLLRVVGEKEEPGTAAVAILSITGNTNRIQGARGARTARVSAAKTTLVESKSSRAASRRNAKPAIRPTTSNIGGFGRGRCAIKSATCPGPSKRFQAAPITQKYNRERRGRSRAASGPSAVQRRPLGGAFTMRASRG